MPGKMRAALNQFSYNVMKIRVGEARGSNVRLIIIIYWDFRDALRRKSLCFFSVQNYVSVNQMSKTL